MRASGLLQSPLGKTLRQRTQKAARSGAPVPVTGRLPTPTSRTTNTAEAAPVLNPSQSSGHTVPAPSASPTHSPSLPPAPRVDKHLQNVLLGRTRESSEVHAFQTAMRRADSKRAAADAFLLLSRSSGEPVSAATLKTFSSTLLERHAESMMSRAAYSAALSDVVGGADEANDRWRDTSLEERRCFAAYVCRELARRAEKGTTFNKDVGLTVEGSDNEVVSLTEYHLRKAVSQDKMLPAPTDVLMDLAHLDVSWQVGLRLLDYARELRGNTVPAVEMNDRITGLMTGYKTNGLGSRPWTVALHLYQNALEAGLELTTTTHTHALDAVWRSADSFHKTHNTVSDAHRQWMLEKALAIQEQMARSGLEDRLAGEEGCAYMESLIKATSAAGRWETAVRLLLEMETQPRSTSRRLLVPTAESYLFATVACHVAGHSAHAEALTKLFLASEHTLRAVHSEVLLIYLQSLRRQVKMNARAGAVVEELLTDGHGLDRPCAVACLQLLSSPHVVVTARSKTALAKAAFDLYDGSVWIQQPVARKVELQTVFRCCHLVDSHEQFVQGRDHAGAVVAHVRERLRTVFGPRSAELEWLNDTEVYALMVTDDVEAALAIYDRQVTRRPLEKVKFLPMPLRGVRLLLARTLLRCCRSKMAARDSSEAFALEDEDFHHGTQQELEALLSRCVAECRAVFANDAGVPREVMAELLLMQATTAANYTARKQLATEALQHLALGSAVNISSGVLHLVSEALSLTTLHVETTVIEEHAKLRAKTLTDLEGEPATFEESLTREYL